MSTINFEPNPSFGNKDIIPQSKFINEVFNANNPPTEELVQQMVDFDKLCFEGIGRTTSKKYAPTTLTAEDIKKGIDRNNKFLVVKDKNNNIVAVIQTFIKGKEDQEKEVHLMSMAIDPKHRGKGLANTLLQGVYEEAKENNLDKITLRVDPLNIPAISKYIHEGFIFLGGRTARLDDEHINVVTLAGTRRLSQTPTFYDEISQSVSLEDYVEINNLAQNGYAGVSIDNSNLIMKKLTNESKELFPSWS